MYRQCDDKFTNKTIHSDKVTIAEGDMTLQSVSNNGINQEQDNGELAQQQRAIYNSPENFFNWSWPSVPRHQFLSERDRAFDPDGDTGLIELDISDKLQSDYVRLISLSSAFIKLKNSNLYETLFGTGWYTSRELLKPIMKDALASAPFSGNYIVDDDSSLQAEGFVLLITDIGLVGFSFTFLFVFLTFRRIIKTNSSFSTKLLSSTFLFLTCFFISLIRLLIGSPFEKLGKPSSSHILT